MLEGSRSENSRHARLVVLIAVTYVALVGFLLLYLRSNPSLATSTDVEAYINYAARLRQAGFSADFGNIRTYGYPAFLALLSFLVQPLSLPMAAGILQAVLYGCASLWAVRKLTSQRFARIALCGLLLNPYLVSIVVDAVSDAPSLVSFVLLSGLTLRLQSNGDAFGRRGRLAFLGYFALGTAIACFAVMIRPANVLLLAAWLCGAALSLTSCKDDLREKISLSAAALAILGLFAFVFWYPQYIYNVAWYGRASIFPVCPIGSLQITYGLFNLKYETIIAQGAASSLYYPNPWFTGALPAGPIWTWYLLHPVDGAATIVAHVFAAFTIDHLFVYRYEGAGAPLIVPILGWALISTGLLAIDAAIRGNQWWRRGDTPVWVHTGVVALGSILFCMGAAVETRMALFPLAVISVASVYGLAGVIQRPGDHRAAIAACLLIVLTGSAGAIGLRSLETTNLMLLSKDFARLHFPCYHAHPAQ